MNKPALIFPGQSSQYAGMGEKLCREFQVAAKLFDEAGETLGFDLRKLCAEGSIEELTKTENTQPAVLTVSVAAFKVYMQEIGVEPALCAGHSLGEISALTCAQAISFKDAVRLVSRRGKFMQEAVLPDIGAMMAINGLSKSRVEDQCRVASGSGQVVVVSNVNSNEQIVISGEKDVVNAVGEALKKEGATAIPLKVSAPFHSPLMRQAADRIREELGRYKFYDLKYPVISNVDALPYKGTESIVENLVNQIVMPVQWKATMDYIVGSRIKDVIELGPGEVLKKLAKKNSPGIKAYSFDREQDVKALKENLRQSSAVSSGLYFIIRCLAIAVCTKNKNWNEDEYRKGVSEPYKEVQKMLEQLEQEKTEPTRQQMQSALDMLKSVFLTKYTPKAEQAERFRQLYEETGADRYFKDQLIEVMA